MGLTVVTLFLASCRTNDGGGDEHATQIENIGDEPIDEDISGDTTTLGDTTATM